MEEEISFNQIVQGYYPRLTIEDIKACVRYVVDLVAAEEVDLREASFCCKLIKGTRCRDRIVE